MTLSTFANFLKSAKNIEPLKFFYLRNKACLRLMKVTSNFDSKCFESMDYLGNVNVGIVKRFHTIGCMRVLPPEQF